MKLRQRRGKYLLADWKITEIGSTNVVLADYRFGEIQIFGRIDKAIPSYRFESITGDYGFAINRYNAYEGFISADENTKRVTRISFSGKIVDTLYGNGKNKIDMEEFVLQFTKHFDLPDFSWIAYGWYYESPMGYVITLKTNRLIDIKMDEQLKAKSDSSDNKSKINF